MKDQEPDFTGSTTGASECWKNPLYPMHERLEMADGAIGYRDRIIKQLRDRLEAREVLEVAHAEMLKEIHAMGAESYGLCTKLAATAISQTHCAS